MTWTSTILRRDRDLVRRGGLPGCTQLVSKLGPEHTLPALHLTNCELRNYFREEENFEVGLASKYVLGEGKSVKK